MHTHNEQPFGCDTRGSVAPPDQLLLKADEVAKLLGIGRTKVYELMKGEVIPTVRIGTAVRVPRVALLQWIEKNTVH